MHFNTRSQAAKAAQKVNVLPGAFWTLSFPDRNGLGGRRWKYASMTKNVPAAIDWAKGKDYIAWVETHYIDGGRQPGVRAVMIVSVTRDEIPLEDSAEATVLGYSFEPMTPDLWGRDKGSTEAKSTRSTTGGQRAKSDVESPTKLVWKIADEMPGADRKEVVAACVAAGVNQSTASTQYYRWQKAKSA